MFDVLLSYSTAEIIQVAIPGAVWGFVGWGVVKLYAGASSVWPSWINPLRLTTFMLVATPGYWAIPAAFVLDPWAVFALPYFMFAGALVTGGLAHLLFQLLHVALPTVARTMPRLAAACVVTLRPWHSRGNLRDLVTSLADVGAVCRSRPARELLWRLADPGTLEALARRPAAFPLPLILEELDRVDPGRIPGLVAELVEEGRTDALQTLEADDLVGLLRSEVPAHRELALQVLGHLSSEGHRTGEAGAGRDG